MNENRDNDGMKASEDMLPGTNPSLSTEGNIGGGNGIEPERLPVAISPMASGNSWDVRFPEPGGRKGRRKRRETDASKLKPRPRQIRAAQETRLFDYMGREKGGLYGALVPVIAGYIIPAGIIVLLLYGLLFGSMVFSAAFFPDAFLDSLSSFADSFQPGLDGFATMPDMNQLIQDMLPFLAVLMLVTFILAIPFLLLFTRHVEKRKFRTLGFQGKKMGRKFLLGLLAGALAAAIPFFAGAVITRSPISFNPQISGAWVLPQLLAFGFFCIQGSFEELFFRGWSFTTLGKRFGRWRAVVVSSLVFASLHFMFSAESLLTMVNAFSIGVFFCVLSMITGDIAMACGFHAVWNYMQFTLLTGIGGVGGWFVSPMDMENDLRYTLVIISWTAILALIGALIYRRRVKREGAQGFLPVEAAVEETAAVQI